MGKQWLLKQMPVLAMVGLQLLYAIMVVVSKAAGISPMVFLVYRQISASLLLVPISIISIRRRPSELRMGRKGFYLVFMAALIGVTINQSLYYQGLRLASATIASCLINIVPALTFLMAAAVGLEKVQPKSIKSMAKPLGTIICIVGAIIMTLFKGPRLLNLYYTTIAATSFLRGTGENWGLGCLLLIASFGCFAAWFIIQVPICRKHLDPLSLSTWMSILSALQSAMLTLFMESDLRVWIINAGTTLPICLLAGLVAAIGYCIQSWCIARRGPLFCAMFSPLTTVFATIGASIFLHEKLYIGSLAGSTAVIVGLYIVLWGKSGDLQANKDDHQDITTTENDHQIFESDLEEPLIHYFDERSTPVS